MYLDYAELQAAHGRVMTMKDWVEKLNAFLKFSEYEILTNAGKISHEVAEMLALNEFEKYRKEQDKNYISDFDREVKKLYKKHHEKSFSHTPYTFYFIPYTSTISRCALRRPRRLLDL